MPGSARDCLPRAKFWNLRDSRFCAIGLPARSPGHFYLDPPCHGCEGDWPANGPALGRLASRRSYHARSSKLW